MPKRVVTADREDVDGARTATDDCRVGQEEAAQGTPACPCLTIPGVVPEAAIRTQGHDLQSVFLRAHRLYGGEGLPSQPLGTGPV